LTAGVQCSHYRNFACL